MVHGLKDAQAAIEMWPSEAHPRLYSFAYYLVLSMKRAGLKKMMKNRSK